ncbi:hypothetical protein [Acidimangrovimonas sediminis]|uniref:hypothetical protein n=1 Tax=Acidimangrovimonas sediminis TaxID=2056283 RepID=UPI000C7FEB65|nr:hypothetical protein [Acidimangrovimonas sediminis]
MRAVLPPETAPPETACADADVTGSLRAELSTLTARVSDVLAAAHAAGRLVEDSYGDMIRAIPPDALRAVRAATDAAGHQGPARGLQELDRLVQVLDNMARFMAVLAEAIPGELLVETAAARQEILLRDLARALLDPPGEAWPTQPRAAASTGGDEDLCIF